MKKNKFFIKAITIGCMLLITVILCGCGAKLGNKSIHELKTGDTIFVNYAGEYIMAIVDKNYSKHKIVACRRNSLFDANNIEPSISENYTYSELRGW